MPPGLLQNRIYRNLFLNVNFLSNSLKASSSFSRISLALDIANDGLTHPKRSQVDATSVLAALLYLNEGSRMDRWVVGGTVFSRLIKTSQ